MRRSLFDPDTHPLASVIVSLALSAYGIWILRHGEAVFNIRYRNKLTLLGLDAYLYGACLLILAAALHRYSLWPRWPSVANYAEPTFTVLLAVFAVLLGTLVARQFLNFV